MQTRWTRIILLALSLVGILATLLAFLSVGPMAGARVWALAVLTLVAVVGVIAYREP